MENYSQIIVILKYCSKSIEILLPNNYNDLIKIFVEKFQIEKNKEDFLQITYNDDENDNIIIFSEEDFEVFKKLLKENLIKNELIGILSENCLQNIDNTFNIKLDNLLKDIMEIPINNNNLQNSNTKIENSFNSLDESNNEDKEMKEIIIKDNNKLELNSQKQLKDIITYNSEINMLMEENKKQKIKIEELERKMNEQKENYENQINQINLENQKLKEENQKQETQLNEYSIKFFEKEKSYNNLKEYNEKKENENDINIKLLEEKTILLMKNEEEKKKIKNECINKNKELIDIIKEKENIIKEYKINQKKEEEKLNQLIKKNKNSSEQIGKLKKEIEEYKKKIKEINDKNKNTIIDNNTNKNNKILNKNIVNDQQSEEYKKNLEYIKSKYNTELNKKIKEILKTKFDNNIYNEINKQSEIILNNYLQNLEDFEKKRRNDFSQIMNNKNINLNFDINKTMHEGIKCEKCLMKPIIGERYKCSICPDYNLCKKCEEENYNTLKHKHNFIKIRYANIENINKKIDIKKPINMNYNIERKCVTNKNNNEKYSFIIENIQKIYLIYCETKKYEIVLKIKNNSNFEYPEQTQIIYNEKNSTLEPINKIIKINTLIPNKTQNIKLIYDNLETKKSGYYYSFFNFEINGDKIDDIKINIKILENNDFELVEIFKNKINIYSFKSDNNTIIKALKKNSYNFEKTFSYLLEIEDKKK